MKYSLNMGIRKSTPSKRVIRNRINGLGKKKKVGAKTVGSTMFPTRNGKKGFFNKAKLRKVLYISVGILFFIVCVCLVIVGLYLKNLQKSLPSPDSLVERDSDQSTQIFDRNNTLLYTVYGDQNREFVKIEDIPEHTKWAVLAAEDIEFYQHKGIDYTGIVMSAIRNFTSGSIVRGASTITQQLVKNTILYDILGDEAYKQTYTRKIKEILITMQVEQTFTKDQILQMYMNEIPLGGVNYGFQAAAHAYFGKNVQDLSLAESALIAGLIQSPGSYSPLYGTNPDMAKVRQNYVLDQMLKHKDLTGVTEEEIEAARNEELVYSSTKIDIKAPHFVFYVKQQLEEKYGVDRVERGGLKVTTTLDYSAQEIAEEEVEASIAKNKKTYNVNNGGAVVIDPNTGEILAMVGSVDYWNTTDKRVDGNVNVTTSLRQVGSSAKPYTYLAAITAGYGPWTLAPDIEMKFGNYAPDNWDNKFEGVGTARKNLGRSRNLPAVYTLQLAGIDRLLQTAEKLGITTLNDKADYGLALALGAGEMKLVEHTAAFGVFANEGVKNDTIAILKVEDSKGNIIEEKDLEAEGTRVFDEKEIYLLNYTICNLGGQSDRLGAGYSTLNGKNLCFKTGTTNGPRDITVVMYHKNLVVGIWGGNNDNSLLPGAWGSSIPLPMAYNITKRLSDRYAVETFTRPAGVLSATVCTDTGATPSEGTDCKKEATVYIQGHAPQKDTREKIYVCKSNGLIPTNLEAAQKYNLVEEKTVINFKIENTLQQKTWEEYMTSKKGGRYLLTKPESGLCPLPLGTDNAPVVEVTSPLNNPLIKVGETLSIKGNVRYLESITSFSVKVDSNDVIGATLDTSGNFDITYNISTLSVSEHTVTITATDNYGKVGTSSAKFTIVP